MLRFKVKLETFTPIHIGCGEEYYPFEYYVDEKQKKLFVVDENKLLDNVEKNNKIEEFTKLASTYTQTNSSLLGFIKNLAVDNYRYGVDIEHGAFNYITRQTAAFRAGISRFIRNGYDDKVYIPGSTFKGALRSAFFEMVMLRIEDRYKDVELSRNEILKDKLRKNCQDLNSFFTLSGYSNDAQNDIMKWIKISDLTPVGDTKETIYKVFAVKKPHDDGTREVQDIPDILETVDKESVFEGEININEKFLEGINGIFNNNRYKLKPIKNITENNLAMWIRNFYRVKVYSWEKRYFNWSSDAKFFGQDQYSHFEQNLRSFGREFSYNYSSKNEFYIKIGKHGGAVSKTIDGCRQIKIKVGRNYITSDHQSTLWLAGGYPMGWVKGRIEKIG